MKQGVNDLAIFGGKPLFSSVRPIGQLALPPSDIFFQHAKNIFSSKRLTNNGPLSTALEKKLCEIHGTNECVAFCNASIAIVALLKILSIFQKKEVIMPAFTYPGLPHLAQWAGMKPRFCDINPVTHTLSAKSVENNISSDTGIILGVHQVNSPCEVDLLQKTASKHSIPLIFDSVHGVGCTYKRRPIGGEGIAEVFSLHATKIINGFEGGYVTTNNTSLADELRLIRNFGFSGEDNVTMCGFNGKLNEIHAAMGLSSIEIIDEIIKKNKKRYEYYLTFFNHIPDCSIVRYPVGEKYNFEFSLLDISPDCLLSRDYMVKILRKENALARPYYSPPLHLSEHMPAGLPIPSLPVTESEAKRYIQMPVGELVDRTTIECLSELFSFIHENQQTILEKLEELT